MNSKFQISILLFSLVIFASCKKYFEVDNSDRDTLPKTFSTIEGFKASLAGTYTTLYKYYSTEFYLYPEAAGNMADLRKVGEGTLEGVYNFMSSPEDETAAVGYIWRKAYVTIVNANNIIENAPIFLEKNPDKKSEIDPIKAQALFIRALAHFDLCRVYAQPYNYTADASHLGIPVSTSNPAPETPVARSTVKQVYTQVIADLKEAELLFGASTNQDPYYASKKAAQALLARVYLYAENWDEAINYANTVISNSVLAYGNDYKAMFINLEVGKESIFRVNGQLQSKILGAVSYSQIDPIYVPSDLLMSLFNDSTDIRFSLFSKVSDNPLRYFTNKWNILLPHSAASERYDPIVLRASEMYFIRSEANLAKNNTAAAAADLKIIIGRALNKKPEEVALTTTDKTVLEKTITEERAKEFCFEGHNFFDIVRRKQNLVRGATTSSTVKSINYPSDLFVLPIPQSELDANPAMKGNPTVNR